ncbi:hypothetical protein GP486_001493 [Trichoglossum hirsutum]|uniref:Carbonyl reductase n=1 Tax=Trichoglossum hirsutum TaxID=265104 RepID=A0A9P8LGQ6_9PEZI|nr:hypothetical protein GP486_001493 [Trichoglossum hirsutum]
MSSITVGVVTGANKGIGLAIVRKLALQYEGTPGGNPFLIYLTSRDERRGEEALKGITSDAEVKKAKVLVADGGTVDIKHHLLDIADETSIKDFTDFLKKEYSQGINFVINNAGIAMNGFDPDTNVVDNTLKTNYYGTLHASLNFLPLIKPHGRLVNVASMVGGLSKYSSSIQSRFLSAASIADVNSIVEDFRSSVLAGTEQKDGWPRSAYAVSKAGVIGLTRAIAAQEEWKARGILINSCCPGWVRTDMTRGGGVKTPDQGAETPVLLAVGDIGESTGLFWQNERPIRW